MSGYSWISGISIFCYLFLLLSFVTSKNKEGVIRSFEILLVIMILWTGGSMGMRLQFWPSVNFWHHVSLLGMMLLCYGYYQFLLEFLDEESKFMRQFLAGISIALFIFNCITNFFIPLPEVVSEGGQMQFLYHYEWKVILLILPMLFILWQTFVVCFRFCRGNTIAYRQLIPVIGGLLVIVVGNILSTLPIFTGLPVDMLSGAVNAFFLFYALYKRRLFRMSIFLNKTNYIVIAILLCCLIFPDIALVAQRTLTQEAGLDNTAALLIIVAGMAAIIAALYFLIDASCNALFTRPEKKKQALLDRFSEEIIHLLGVNEILQQLTETIQNVLEMNRLFVLVKDNAGDYRIEYTLNPLDEKNFYFRADHPVIRYFEDHRGHIMLQDFSRKTVYRSMWESEKATFVTQNIECVVPLNCNGELTGCILLSGKKNKKLYTASNIEFVENAADICSEALNNAYDYERALTKAQKDDLTGLVNLKFFFEVLDREFEKYKDYALSLCLINVDDFKRYNQMYGSKKGDEALQQIASVLSASINENAFAARVDGDVFALILPGYDVYSAKCLAESIVEQIGNITIADTSDKLTVSVGICAAPYMASSARELYRKADTTVYSVKRTGKNAVQMYSAGIDRREAAVSQHKSGYSENASTIFALTAAVDAKDHYTCQHSQNVAYYAAELAKAAGMTPDLVEIVREAGLLHDIGKIGVREEILNKPGKLTADEYELMKSHVENAVNIIRHLPSLEYVIPAVLSHHERYDGKGYPRRLAEEDIPITGRILCIADSFDAITSERNYKKAEPVEKAIAILRAESGKQFDPFLSEVFIDLVESKKLELQKFTPIPLQTEFV